MMNIPIFDIVAQCRYGVGGSRMVNGEMVDGGWKSDSLKRVLRLLVTYIFLCIIKQGGESGKAF